MFAFTASAQTEAPACNGKEKTEKVSATTRLIINPSYPRFSHGKYVFGCIHDVNSYVYTNFFALLCVSLINFQFRGASIKRKLLLYFRRGVIKQS